MAQVCPKCRTPQLGNAVMCQRCQCYLVEGGGGANPHQLSFTQWAIIAVVGLTVGFLGAHFFEGQKKFEQNAKTRLTRPSDAAKSEKDSRRRKRSQLRGVAQG